MKNNKLIIMLLTFVIMVFATPIIFDKLMNSKFNSMLLNIQQNNGIIIKPLKNKSSYIKTDKFYEVTIPGKIINQPNIKYIKLLTEVRFKNLPVTNVIFYNIVKKIVLNNNKELKFLENKLKFYVITPDFKHYKYKVIDNKVEINNQVELAWNNFNGMYVYPKNFKNEDGNIEVNFKKDNLKIFLNHLFSQLLILNKKSEQDSKIKEFSIKAPSLIVDVKNIESKNLKIDKNTTIDISSSTNIKSIDINNIFKMKNATASISFYGLNKKAIEAIAKGDRDKIKELLNDGFRGKLSLDINNVFFMQPLGFVNINVDYNVSKGNNYEVISQNKDIKFLTLDAKIVASPILIQFLGINNPKIASLIRVKNNKAIIVIKINKGHIYINGKEIKSD